MSSKAAMRLSMIAVSSDDESFRVRRRAATPVSVWNGISLSETAWAAVACLLPNDPQAVVAARPAVVYRNVLRSGLFMVFPPDPGSVATRTWWPQSATSITDTQDIIHPAKTATDCRIRDLLPSFYSS